MISAFDFGMRGYHPGVTVFGNEEWRAENTGFDINSMVLDAVKLNRSREVKLVNGDGMHLFPEKEERPRSVKKISSDVTAKLDKLGREWHVEFIVLLFDGESSDLIGQTSQTLTGFGLYKRAGREVVFWVSQVAIFDCKAHRFIGSDQKLDTQRLPDVDWQKNWSEFGLSQQHAVRRELESLIKECTAAILAEVGLNDKPVGTPKRSLASKILFPGANARPSLTESNQLEIPPGISVVSARRAIVYGFKQQEWIVAAETDEEVIGIRRDGKNEARCTVTIKERAIILVHEDYQIQADGKHVPKEFTRWQNNLREAILGNLMGGDVGLQPPPGNQLEVPSAISTAAAHRAVLAGFKDREWTITTESDEQIIGVYRKGKKEAICSVTLKDRVILLVPEAYEIQPDGKRGPAEFRRWQENLKESIFKELMKVTPESVP